MSAPKTLADVALVDLRTRARIVRELCRSTGDVEERFAFVEAAFLGPAVREASVPIPIEQPDGQLAFDLEVAS